MTINGAGYLGLFGALHWWAEISNLGVKTVDVSGFADNVGGLVGYNDGSVTRCYTTGFVKGGNHVGGLAGENEGVINTSFSSAFVYGDWDVGGLVGGNGGAGISQSWSTGTVINGTKLSILVHLKC